MIKGEGKFIRQHKGKGYAAKVAVKVDTTSQHSYVTFECNGKGYAAQGYIEEVPEDGYDDWKMGASEGAKFALKLCNHPEYGVIITKIEGLTTDTNPTIVAIAAAYAIWNAIGFEVQDNVRNQLEEIAFNSWNVPEDIIDDMIK